MVEKELKKKFVVVTSIMMIVIFGVTIMVNDLYMSYCMDQDIYSILELVSKSGIFTEEECIDNEEIFGELTDESPIIGIVFDDNGNELSRKVIGVRNDNYELPDEVVERMYYSDAGDRQLSDYLYSRRVLNNGNVLIVVIPFDDEGVVEEMLITLVLILVCVATLIVASVYLSGFVVAPAKKAIDREKRFVSDASHELKTPLSAIRINAQALEMKGENSIYVRNIITESERMNRLIDRLLTMSKLETDEKRDYKEFSFTQVVEEMLLTFESIAYERNCELHYSVEDGLVQFGDADEMRQLITILIDNAIKNSDRYYPVECNCFRENDRNVIVVKNIGSGISEDDIKHVFDRFYTTDRSRNNGSFGLGLAIARTIVERHNGEINVTSTKQDDSEKYETVFKVSL